MTEEFNTADSSAKSMLRDEFLINMQKFASSISRTIQQIEGEVKLECPDLYLSDSMEENLKDEGLREEVCGCLDVDTGDSGLFVIVCEDI